MVILFPSVEKLAQQRPLTHLKELVEKVESVAVLQMVVPQPVLEFADVTLLHTLLRLAAGLPVAVATLPVKLLCSVSAHTVPQPPVKQRLSE